jgi:DNA-binding GntR family transcriptional regulator
VPIPVAEPSPRRLLRVVAFDRLLAAILDGTLQPGEFLGDDELSSWLGVSRTPIREAIARLEAYGLIDVQARYTRIAERDPAAYADAAQLLAGLHQLGQQWGVTHLGREQVEEILGIVSRAVEQLKEHDLSGVHALLDARGAVAEGAENVLFVEMEKVVRVRVKFLGSRNATDYDWDHLVASAHELEEILRAQA